MKTSDSNLDCNLHLTKDGNYYIEYLEHISDDIIESFILSFGSYIVKENQIILADKVHNYKICMKLTGQELAVKRSFICLLNKKFMYCNNSINNGSDFANLNVNSESLLEARNSYERQHKNLFNFCLGIYENNQGFRLNVQEPHHFSYYYKNILISTGNWERVGNKLVLYDTNINHSFYVLIGDMILISKLLPGDYNSFLLKKNVKPLTFTDPR
jgi:hypothetical protein